MVEKNISNNSVSWTMNCTKDGSVSKSSGKITYNGKTFEGKVKIITDNPMKGRNMNITTVMTGKYIGKCE